MASRKSNIKQSQEFTYRLCWNYNSHVTLDTTLGRSFISYLGWWSFMAGHVVTPPSSKILRLFVL